jgi:putative ABC transport system permease protein
MRVPLALRIVLRDLRGGIGGFGIFLACIALGVAAIVGVGSVSRGLSDGLAREGRRILGGDAAFSLIHRELNEAERSWLSARGDLSTVASMRAMARRDSGDAALVEIKAVPSDYPRIGVVQTNPAAPLQEMLAQRDGTYGFIAEAALAARLDLKVGDRILIGDARMDYRGELTSEPDKLAAGIGFGPRVIMSTEAFRATGLVQPGTLVRFVNRLALPQGTSDAQTAQVIESAKAAFPDAGWEIRSRTNISPQFQSNLDRFTQFLTLVGLTSLIVGGVGVANAVRGYIDRKRADLATLKAIGATGAYVFIVSLVEVMLIAVAGTAIGLVIGSALPFVLAGTLGSLVPFPFEPSVFPSQLAAGAAYGLLTALAFSLLPLGRAHDVPVSALFRDMVDPERGWPRRRYLALALGAAALLIAVIVALATDRRLALIYMAATGGGFVLLRLVAVAITWAARHAPHVRGTELRLAIANIHRPGALTGSVVLSLGLGLALLVALSLIDGNIRLQLTQGLPGQTPSFFFLDVRSSEADQFTRFIAEQAPDAKIERVPMMRGRVVRLNGQRPEEVQAKDEARWVLEGDRGITFSTDVPDGSTLVAGDWWAADYKGPPLVSVEAAVADGLGLKIGDEVVVNVLGRNITARIANLRKVNWRSLGINFVFVYSPNTFAGAPYTSLATATFPTTGQTQKELSLLRAVSKAFPAVTSVRVKEALDAIGDATAKLALGVRAASGVALASSILVLAGALAAGRRSRIYDAVVLKTLGATRARLLRSLLYEYAILGVATAIFGILAGAIAAWMIVTRVMKVDTFAWLWSTAGTATLAALLLTIGLGLAGTWRVLGQKPAPYLRNL